MLGSEDAVFAKKTLRSDTLIFSEWIAEQQTKQKWSIRYLWLHLLVQEHWAPIWAILRSRFN